MMPCSVSTRKTFYKIHDGFIFELTRLYFCHCLEYVLEVTHFILTVGGLSLKNYTEVDFLFLSVCVTHSSAFWSNIILK